MAERRRQQFYASPRDTRLPKSLQATPEEVIIVHRSKSPDSDSHGRLYPRTPGDQSGGKFGDRFRDTSSDRLHDRGHASNTVDYDDVLAGGDSDAIARATVTLQSEINALQDRICTLSTKRTRKVRAESHKTFSDRSSPVDSDTVMHLPKPHTVRPPRTATKEAGVSKKSSVTRHQEQADTYVVVAPDNETLWEGDVSETSKTAGEVRIRGRVRCRPSRALPCGPRPEWRTARAPMPRMLGRPQKHLFMISLDGNPSN